MFKELGHSSDEALAKHDTSAGIFVTSSVGIETHDARSSQDEVENYNHFNTV